MARAAKTKQLTRARQRAADKGPPASAHITRATHANRSRAHTSATGRRKQTKRDSK